MPKSRTRIALATIAISLVVVMLKGIAWQITDSAALYSDALESLVNVAAAAVAYFALRLAALPPDANHTYGHDKAEFFAAVIEGGMIVVASATIIGNAWHVWQHPHAIAAPIRGLAVNLGATAINGVWALNLGRAGRAMRSPALLADSRHLFSDVVTSVGVAIGIGVVVATGYQRLDAILAALIALHVLAQGLFVMRSSIGGLMDEAPDPETMEQVRAVVGASADGAIEAHDLRIRQAGRQMFLEFHLVVPGSMTVDAAHDICDRVETALRGAMQDLIVTIHVEPERKAKHTGVVVL